MLQNTLNTAKKTFLTYSTKGVKAPQINLLKQLQRQWEQGETINTNFLLKALDVCGFEKGCNEMAENLEIWGYWVSMPKPIFKSGLNFNKYFTIAENKTEFTFYVNTLQANEEFKHIQYITPSKTFFDDCKLELIYKFKPQNFYFEIIGGCLWLKYNSIIGSRFIGEIIEEKPKIKTSLKDFNTSLKILQQLQKQGQEIQQNHFGDFLMIETEENGTKYRVWLSHTENVKEGQKKWQIEAFGEFNGYVWETIKEGNF